MTEARRNQRVNLLNFRIYFVNKNRITYTRTLLTVRIFFFCLKTIEVRLPFNLLKWWNQKSHIFEEVQPIKKKVTVG